MSHRDLKLLKFEATFGRLLGDRQGVRELILVVFVALCLLVQTAVVSAADYGFVTK